MSDCHIQAMSVGTSESELMDGAMMLSPPHPNKVFKGVEEATDHIATLKGNGFAVAIH